VAAKKAVQEASLIANDTGFYPSTLFLTRGIGARIFLTGASKKSQCFILDSFGIRRQVRSQKVEEVSFTPDQAGTFSFHCPMNGAKGTLVVKELELSSRAPASMVSEQDFAPEFRKH
jgi:plastocyanin domain-containing protein